MRKYSILPRSAREYSVSLKCSDLIGKGEPCFGEVPYRPAENMCLYADIQKAKNFCNGKLHNLKT